MIQDSDRPFNSEESTVLLQEAFRLLKQEKLTQREFCALAGIDAGFVSNILRGKKRATHGPVERLFEAAKSRGLLAADSFEQALKLVGLPSERGRVADFWIKRFGVSDIVVVDSSFSARRQSTTDENLIHQQVIDVSGLIANSRDWKGVKSRHIISVPYGLTNSHYTESEIDPLSVFESKDVLLVGGPLTNFHVRAYLNYVSNYPLVLWMDFVQTSKAYIYNRITNEALTTQYVDANDRNSRRITDYGVIIAGRNPFNHRRSLVAAMGLRANMTSRLLTMLFEEDGIQSLVSRMEEPLGPEDLGYQFLVEHDYRKSTNRIEVFKVPKRPKWPSHLKIYTEEDRGDLGTSSQPEID